MRRRTVTILSAIAFSVLLLPLWAVGMAGAQVAVVSTETKRPADAKVVPIQVTGDPKYRFTMVVLGDGYTAEEMPKFRKDVAHHLSVLWRIEPFRTYRSYFDVFAVEIPSPESGVDCDPTLTSPRRQTPLDTGLWGGCNPRSVQRLLVVGDRGAAREYAGMATPYYDQILVLGNSETYGGAGGTLATATGGNSLSALITPHELGIDPDQQARQRKRDSVRRDDPSGEPDAGRCMEAQWKDRISQ